MGSRSRRLVFASRAHARGGKKGRAFPFIVRGLTLGQALHCSADTLSWRRNPVMERHAWRLCVTAAVLLFGIVPHAGAQRVPATPMRPVVDTGGKANLENFLAVARSGVWYIDGDYKGKTGQYYKATGYFAYVG